MNSEIPKQLILGVQLRDETTFENFHESAANAALVQSLIARFPRRPNQRRKQ